MQIVEKGIICWLTPFLIFYVLSTTLNKNNEMSSFILDELRESFDIVLSCNWLLFFVVLQKSLVVKERKTVSLRNAKSQKHMMMVRHNKSLLLKKFVRSYCQIQSKLLSEPLRFKHQRIRKEIKAREKQFSCFMLL